jgi:2-polyprenyl-3-methyl-5-hydroxy-6-metoxy-1,4-benzoquinol methylase
MNLTTCQLCNSKRLVSIIDLGHHPLADTFLPEKFITEPYKVYPLVVMLCRDCGHAQLQYSVPETDRYQKVDYSYTASNSPVSVKHFEEMAQEAISFVGVTKGDLVIDVGSNDGTLLSHFKTHAGSAVLGIEPAKNIAMMAKKRGVQTINDFFNAKTVAQILKKQKAGAKVITATNVFNHITDMRGFMKNIAKILHKDGMFVFEVPYFMDLIKQGAFDTIYLEHISYFGVKAFSNFFKKSGLSIAKLETNSYMGGSIRVYVTKDKKKESKDVTKMIKEETAYGMFKLETFKEFSKRIEQFKFDLNAQVTAAKKEGKKIIGIGAATKGNTLLNYCKIDNHMVDFVTDSSPLKIGKFTPGSLIPIKPDSAITKEISYAIILPWNIAEFLVKKLGHLSLEFIIPKMK